MDVPYNLNSSLTIDPIAKFSIKDNLVNINYIIFLYYDIEILSQFHCSELEIVFGEAIIVSVLEVIFQKLDGGAVVKSSSLKKVFIEI